MRRRALSIAAFGICSLLLMHEAAAKGREPVRVVVRGPGLAEPIVVRGEMGDPPGDRYWEFVARAFPAPAEPASRPSTRQDLGPRFTALYSDPCCGFYVMQYLYPYARGGPWTYTPAGQGRDLFQMNMTDVVVRPATGWYRAPDLLSELVPRGLSIGFHEASLAVEGSPVGANTAWVWLPSGTALFTTIFFGAVRVHRRRRRQGPLEVPASI